MRKLTVLALLFVVCAAGVTSRAFAGDWPQWRYDAARSASTPDTLPLRLNPIWERSFSPREMAWGDGLNQDRMPYDKFFEPIVAGKTLYLAFNDSDKILALHTETGEERWSFYAEGPVRFPPAVQDGRLVFVSDDGYLYCLDADTGALLWKFLGGPSERKLLGNYRLISTWPARGGAVIEDGIVYFAASIWPFMGTFVYALNLESGAVLWRNDSTGAMWINQPHRNPAFAGIAPQGALCLSQDALLVPGGRSVPACFERETGAYRYFHYDEDRERGYGKYGGSFVCAGDGLFFNHHVGKKVNVYGLEDGYHVSLDIGDYPCLEAGVIYTSGDEVTAWDSAKLLEEPKKRSASRLWRCKVDATGDLIKAGPWLYAAGEAGISIVGPPRGERDAKVMRHIAVEGSVVRLIAADDKLFAVTLEGRLLALGNHTGDPEKIEKEAAPFGICTATHGWARDFLKDAQCRRGYALVFGVGEGDRLGALADASDLSLIAFDNDQEKIDKFRRYYDATGYYGRRIHLLPTDLNHLQLPPYMASLILVEEVHGAAFEQKEQHLRQLYKLLRPYGGKLWINPQVADRNALLNAVDSLNLPGAAIKETDSGIFISREGALPGSASWTHQYGNIANTVKSDDSCVRMPLGLLWFGNNANTDVLPRHGHGPSPQIIGGRLFIQGIDCISARDVYTGVSLWKTVLGDLGTYDVYYDDTYLTRSQNQQHRPGANARGTNFISTMDSVYILQKDQCIVLDSRSGERLRTLSLPEQEDKTPPEWGYIGVHKDLLIGASSFAGFSKRLPEDAREFRVKNKNDLRYLDYDKSASMQLFLMDPESGAVKWSLEARHGFLHNAIVAGKDTIYCIDGVPPYLQRALTRRGKDPEKDSRLLALDFETGAIKWEITEDVFGSWLGYSEAHDALLQATRPSGDMVRGEEGKRMIVYRASSGEVLWDIMRKYDNPPILHNDRIITAFTAYKLLTGEQCTRTNPITGAEIPWKYERSKGCGYHIACENLLTFRSSAAAYYDLNADAGTGHYGGFKSGCSANLIAADGILNAPDYTRTCTCAYQNQSSLAFVHMPEVEVWTTFPKTEVKGPVKQLGLNFGAPGDRMDDAGVLWLEYPVVGGHSPEIPIEIDATESGVFRDHASFVDQGALRWVGASGVEGLKRLAITLATDQQERNYRLELYFSEPKAKQPGERIFDIAIQGKPVLSDFDILKESPDARSVVVKTFEGVAVTDELILDFSSKEGAPLLCGIKIVAQ